LINPAMLAFAAVENDSEGTGLRLVFAGQGERAQCELRLSGMEARSVLRWLRSNAHFLDAGVPPSRLSRPASGAATRVDHLPASSCC
jgi:hypothetical protein